MDKEYTYRTATKLYNICKNDGCNTIPDPVNWVYNKEKMLFMWNSYCNDLKDKEEPFKSMMLCNSLGLYMKFMSDNF